MTLTDDRERHETNPSEAAAAGPPCPPYPPNDAAAVLAHELRGPLAVVNGYLDLLGRADNPEARAYALGAAQRAVMRMDALIDNVLESLRQPAALSSAGIELRSLVHNLLADVPAYGARVVVSSAGGCRVFGNELGLERALSNVLDNALKYSPADSVVHVTLLDAGEHVLLVVEDEGPGIDDGDALLGRRYERLGQDASVPGYGIGLSLVMELIHGMGGEVHVASREGVPGARVEIRLRSAREGCD